MAYAAPLGNDIQFGFSGAGYTAPGGTVIPFDFQGSTLDVNINGSGGVLAGGSAGVAVSSTWSDVGTGGTLVGGTAPNSLFIPNTYTDVGSGGVLVGGTAPDLLTGSMSMVASGGVLVGGTAPNEAAYVYTNVAAGGVAVGGTAANSLTLASILNFTGSGGVIAGGTALVNTLIDEATIGGGVKIGGAAINSSFSIMDYSDIGSGGIRVSGTAPNEKVVPTLDVTLPRPNMTLRNAGFTDYIFAQSTGRMWADITAQVGASVDAALPILRAEFNGLQGASGVISAELPVADMELTGAENVVDGILAYMPVPQPSITALAGGVGAVGARMPTLESSFDGYTQVQGTVDARMPVLRPAMFSLAGTVGSIDAVMNRMRVDVFTVRGTTGVLASVLPSVDSALGGYTSISGAINAALSGMDSAIVGDVRPQHVTALVANTVTAALSEYDDFDFTSFCEYKGAYYAAGPSGLYRIELGDTDAGVPIDASFSTGDLDFDSEMQKRISDFYMGLRTKGDLTLNIATDEGDPVEYTLAPYAVETLKQRRVITAKGARGKYWRFEVANTDGCDFEVDTMNVAVVPGARRI